VLPVGQGRQAPPTWALGEGGGGGASPLLSGGVWIRGSASYQRGMEASCWVGWGGEEGADRSGVRRSRDGSAGKEAGGEVESAQYGGGGVAGASAKGGNRARRSDGPAPRCGAWDGQGQGGFVS
jgi:hypothetical protein